MGRKINLNTASKDELDQITGIGDDCAEQILDYRSKHGKINTIEELGNIPGFGKKAVEHLREQAEV
ncbi:MAG: helix-hairpin-helix domain-containing protein [Pseudomonadota bacterium]